VQGGPISSFSFGFPPAIDYNIPPYDSYTYLLSPVEYDFGDKTGSTLSGATDAGCRFLRRVTTLIGVDDPGRYHDYGSDGLPTRGTLTKTEVIDPDTGVSAPAPWSGLLEQLDPNDFSTVAGTWDGTTYVPPGGPILPFLYDTEIQVSVPQPYNYFWRIAPSATCYFKFWWKEVFRPTNMNLSAVAPQKNLTVGSVSNGGVCIPPGCILHNPATWPKTAAFHSDNQVSLEDLRFSCLKGYEPRAGDPLAYPIEYPPDPNGFPFPT
jgi:hypothetical protein